MAGVLKTSARCPTCNLQPTVCICGLIPTIFTKTKVSLIVHKVEARKPTNSGILATRCLPNSDVFIRGDFVPMDEERLLDGSFTPLVLFPSDDAQILTTDYVASLDPSRPVQLIVPDGNWKQAKSIPKRIAALQGVPRVILAAGPYSVYKLRREPIRKPHGLATMEAIARALAVLEGPAVHDQLMDMFETMVSRCLWQRGVIPDDAVRGGFVDDLLAVSGSFASKNS